MGNIRIRNLENERARNTKIVRTGVIYGIQTFAKVLESARVAPRRRLSLG